jgi:predicted lipoprotein with Yx(FWY)xxD motif
MRRTYLAIGALALVGVLVIAGCGSSSSSTSGGGAEESGSETASEGGGAYGGGGGGESEGSSAKEESGAEPAAAAGEGAGGGAVMVIKVGNAGKVGKVLVDSKGLTVYDFHKDKGTTSSCYGGCEKGWPPVLTSGKAKATGGAQASMLGTTKRKDGSLQVTYNGHPLYTFVEDKKPGEANGNDVSAFGAQWYSLEASGEESAG